MLLILHILKIYVLNLQGNIIFKKKYEGFKIKNKNKIKGYKLLA